MTQKKIALFIDADNVSSKFGKQIIDVLNNRGELFIRRIYGNWEKGSLHGWNDTILNFSLRAVQQPDFVTGKNATDMCLTIDAMDVLHEGKAEIFALVSNDSDFTPLVIRLREGGMTIIGLGNSGASNAFRAACNEFIDLDALAATKNVCPPTVEKKFPATQFPAPKKFPPVQMSLFGEEKIVTLASQPVVPTTQSAPVVASTKVVHISDRKSQSERDKMIQQIHDILRESATAHGDLYGFSSINHARQDIKNKNLNFTVRDFGYAQLRDFIAAFTKLYETRQDESGQNFCYRCRTSEPKKFSVDTRLDTLHNALRAAVADCADDKGFANLCSVGAYVTNDRLGFGVKNLGYGTLQKFLAAFPDRYEMRKDGNKIFLRCRSVKEELPAVEVADVHDVEKISGEKISGEKISVTEKIFSAEKFSDDDNIAKLHELFRKMSNAHRDETGFTDLSHVGNCLGKQKIGFGIRSLGYSTLQKFVADFPDRYEVRKTDKKIFYRCREVDAQTSVAEKISVTEKISGDDKLRQLHDILREAASVHHDATGYSLLNYAGQEIKRKQLGFGIKDFGYGQLYKFVADFPELYEVTRDEGRHIYRYRCKSQK